jgi:DNA repair protein RadA/Sms
VSVAGGLRILEPAVDLPLALALASALQDRPVPLDVAAFGELGLTGQVRPVAHAGARLGEATRLGMRRVLGRAPASLDQADAKGLLRVTTVSDALEVLR